MSLGLLLLGTACDDGGGGGPSCPPGRQNCACQAGDICDAGLKCSEGFCVPDTCPEGSDGCPCFANNTCDAGLECQTGVCQSESCPAGTQGCPCVNGTTCDAGLECQQGVCADPGCPVGTDGCPCDAQGGCGAGLVCEAGTCRKENCPAGTEGCPCDAGSCQGALECRNDICEQPQADHGVSVGAAAVRACDVMFDVGATGAMTIGFGDAVLGRFKKDGTRIAFSFSAKADAALSGVVATVLDSGGLAIDASGITPSQAVCHDRLGKAVASPDLKFE